MDLSGALYLTAAVMIAVFAGIVMVTRRFLRRTPDQATAQAIDRLADALHRANALNERRIESIEARLGRLEDGHKP